MNPNQALDSFSPCMRLSGYSGFLLRDISTTLSLHQEVSGFKSQKLTWSLHTVVLPGSLWIVWKHDGEINWLIDIFVKCVCVCGGGRGGVCACACRGAWACVCVSVSACDAWATCPVCTHPAFCLMTVEDWHHPLYPLKTQDALALQLKPDKNLNFTY